MSDNAPDDMPGGSRWEEDPGNDRISRLASAVTQMLGGHPDGGKDLHGFVTIRDESGDSGSGAFGYGRNPGTDMAADFIKFTGQLLAASGVRMILRFRQADGSEEEISPGDYSPLDASDPGKPEAELVITGMKPDERMQKACQLITDALAGEDLLQQSKVIIMLGLEGTHGVLLHHGYGEDTHEVVHTLLAALMQADDGSHLIMAPMGGHPN